VLVEGMAIVHNVMLDWSNVDVELLSRILAVPVGQRSRRQGTPGELVHHEEGFACIAENLPKHTYTLVAATAVQVLDDQVFRLHGSVEMERWDGNGNERTEHWRESTEVPAGESAAAARSLMERLLTSLGTARQAFDEGRAE
jgi:hypothetical protein